MLLAVLHVLEFLRLEPVSLHRETLTRLLGKRPQLDISDEELLERYEHAKLLIDKRSFQALGIAEVLFLLKYPRTSINLIKDREIQIDDLQRFKKRILSKD